MPEGTIPHKLRELKLYSHLPSQEHQHSLWDLNLSPYRITVEKDKLLHQAHTTFSPWHNKPPKQKGHALPLPELTTELCGGLDLLQFCRKANTILGNFYAQMWLTVWKDKGGLPTAALSALLPTWITAKELGTEWESYTILDTPDIKE